MSPLLRGCRTARRFFFPLLLLLQVSASAYAEKPVLPRPRGYVSGIASEFDAEDNPGRLEDEGSSWALGCRFGYRVKRYLELEGEFLGASAQFDNGTVTAPFFGTVSDEMHLDLTALVLRARALYPLGRFEPYLGAGVGFGRAELTVFGTLLGIPGIAEEQKDWAILYEISIGANLILSSKVDLGFEYRDLQMEADFGDLSGGSVDTGGKFYSLVLGFRLGSP